MSNNQDGKIKDVWEENMIDELRKISELLEEYNYISMDTEFPGIVYPLNPNTMYTTKNLDSAYNKDKATKTENESNYKNIKNNVDNLKVIQVGITLANENGEYPEDVSTWQFNFKFDLDRDTYLSESINLLEIAGIDFKSFLDRGIDADYFGELFTTSGLVLNDNIKWITFHGSYDFAYLLRVLTNQFLPEDELPFNDMLGIYFPCYYDIRHMIRNTTWLKGSLSRISTDLDIRRIGHTHQAGSDSLVTSKVFFKLVQSFNDHIDLNNDKNKLFGFVYKMYDEYDYNMGYNYNPMNNYMPMPGSVNLNNKAGGKNMMYYQNVNTGFSNNTPNMGMNPMMYNNYNNMSNFNPIYPQGNYDYNYYNNYYPQTTGFKQTNGVKDKYSSQG